MPVLHILWDASQIWGILAARAAMAMALPFRLVRAGEIADGLLLRERPSMLLVPGGGARLKAAALGPGGIAAIREYVAGGGQYLGFCGGAGLALAQDKGFSGLGLCPWRRGSFDDRMQHFMSGHMRVTLAAQGPEGVLPERAASGFRLPVWWPGRFAPHEDPSVTVLASYAAPAGDFWLADLPTADLPPDIFTTWREVYGLSFSPHFLEGQPCVIYGEYGKGSYILSYSHLETPDSPDANRWLAGLLRGLGGLEPSCETLPPWRLREDGAVWEDALLVRMRADLGEVLQTGLKHGLLFARTDWLCGWRTGMPGAGLNNLAAALGAALEHEPCRAARLFWEREGEGLAQAMSLFGKGCIQYLLAERLAMTMAKSTPESVPPNMLKDQRDSLFGPPMRAGGLYRELMEGLEELAFLQLERGGS